MRDFVADTNILTSNLTTGQTTAAGCLLAGFVHFNVGRLKFSNGEVEFILRNAHIIIELDGAQLENVAYTQDYIELVSVEGALEFEESRHRTREKNFGASFKFSQKRPEVAADAGAREADRAEAAHSNRTLVSSSEQASLVVFSNDADGGRWLCGGRNLLLAGQSIHGIFGNVLNKTGNEDQVLANVRAHGTYWSVRAKLGFTAADVTWLKFDVRNPKLQAFADWLLNEKRPESLLGRMAFAKWFAHRAPRHPFFAYEHFPEMPE